jgi:hypothetical protein
MIPFLVVFAAFSLVLLGVYLGISIAREKPSDYEDISQSVKNVAEQWVSVDMSEETTPPTDLPMSYEEDETQEVDCEAVKLAEAFLMSLADLEDMGE